MKKRKRVVSAILFLCIVVSLVPPVQFVGAETAYRYELDVDGIDVGATYLIVNTGTAGVANALRFRYTSLQDRSFQNQGNLTVQTQNGVTFIQSRSMRKKL